MNPDLPRMPALFIGHGSPMNTLEDNGYTAAWRDIGRRFTRPHHHPHDRGATLGLGWR